MTATAATPYAIDPADRLPALADFLGAITSGVRIDPDSAEEETIFVREIKIDLPIELNLMQELGEWQLDAAPPTQKIETTVMPVWHRLRLRVTLDNGERNLEPLES